MKMRKLTCRGLFACAALLVTMQANAALRATPEFEDGSTRPVSIALIPVHASVVKAKIVQTENLVDESSELGGYLGAELAALLREQGYEVKLIDAEQVNSDPRLQEYIVDANRRYDEMAAQIRRSRVKRRIYNAGDEVKILADYLDVDAIAFTRLQVVAATGGRTAVALLVGIGSTGGTTASVSLVDGNSGDLEAYMVSTRGASYTAIEEDPQGQMVRIAESTLRRLPAADPAARVELSDEEGVLAEPEALLE